MDHGERIAKAEANVDSIQQQLAEIRAEQVRLREGQDKLRDGQDRLRDHMDRGLADLHAELTKSTRWLIGMTFTYGIAIVGILGRMANLY